MLDKPFAGYRPLTIPFKLGSFLHPRQLELEQALQQSATLHKLEELEAAAPEGPGPTASHDGIRMGEGVSPALDEAVTRLRTVARLPWPFEVILVPHTRRLTCRGRFVGRRLELNLSPVFLERAAGQLVFHLAVALFNALHPRPRQLAALCDSTAPIELEDRLRIIDLLRFQAYGAVCFGLVCCQDPGLAVHEVFFRWTGLDSARLNLDPLRLASHQYEQHPQPVAELLRAGGTRFPMLPVESLALRRFAASALYRQCLGEAGGTSREQFEAEVLELDQQAHPPITRLPEDHLEFVALASLLAGRHILEATGPLTPARYRRCLDFFQLDQEQVDKLTCRHLNCLLEDADDGEGVLGRARWMPGAKAGELLSELLRGPRLPWIRFHSAGILKHSILFGLQEHQGRCPRPVLRAIEEVGNCCLLDSAQVMTLLETVRKGLPTAA
jgi:hypothetical protein